LNQEARYNAIQSNELINKFIASRRDGLSLRTIDFYRDILRLSNEIIGLKVTGQQIQRFVSSLHCHNGGKHAYYRVLRAFYNRLYSPKSRYDLEAKDNPILIMEL